MKVISVNKDFDVEVCLDGSKSESNRALMLSYYGKFPSRAHNLSHSDDTLLLCSLLEKIRLATTTVLCEIDCGNAGTVFRFLATALAIRRGEWLLTGSSRMLHRPVGGLVDALRQLGADIEYCGDDGFPPLLIHGKPVTGFSEPARVTVNIAKSSQFASSLLLAAPTLPAGMMLHLEGAASSWPYLEMTTDIMHRHGAETSRDGFDILVQHSDYQDVEYEIESDWSGASYWYEAVALSHGGSALLRGLRQETRQGDAVVTKIFQNLGVSASFRADAVFIEKCDSLKIKELRYDFIDTPDLFLSIAATCVGLGVRGRFTGIRNLAHKESDRVAAMATELSKIGVIFEYVSDNELIINRMERLPMFSEDFPLVFSSHGDHRVGMALAPLALKLGAVEVEDADVVSKSYPNFWKEMSKIFSLPSLG